jgi:hypothetical protein
VHWANTFGYVLLPGGVAGALLALSPLTFTAILIVHIGELPSLAQDGIGGGAIGAPVVGIVEGYALSRRGSRVGRCLAAAAFLCGLLVTGNWPWTRPHHLYAPWHACAQPSAPCRPHASHVTPAITKRPMSVLRLVEALGATVGR